MEYFQIEWLDKPAWMWLGSRPQERRDWYDRDDDDHGKKKRSSIFDIVA